MSTRQRQRQHSRVGHAYWATRGVVGQGDLDNWNPPPGEVILSQHAVHVWRASLDLPDALSEEMAQILSSDERVRAARYRFDRDRARFIAGRGTLRKLLGRYLSCDPTSLQFACNQYGKPAISEGLGVSFNLAHANGIALLAFTRGSAVGIDLEQVRADVAIDSVSARFFSAAEVEMLRRIPDTLRRKAFFACWTRKEAYVKARGMGMSLDLSMFDVSVDPRQMAALVATREDLQRAQDWTMRSLSPVEGYIGAVAVNGPMGELCLWEWCADEDCQHGLVAKGSI